MLNLTRLHLGIAHESQFQGLGIILTKKERASMVQLIDKIFGPTLQDKNANHIVSSAWIIKYGLTRPNYKAADEL